MRPQNATIARAWRVTPEILALAREPRYTVRMPLGDGRARDFRALTIRKNAQGHANIYPIGSNQTEPDLLWDGLEFFCEPPLCPRW